jgi:Zn-dependent protease
MLGGNAVAFLIGSVFLIPAIPVAMMVHELGHGLAAYWMGDPSPRNRGFLRPDPRLFVNVYGVIAAFLLNVTFGTPVPINEYRLQGNGRKLVYALAGPIANLVVAVLFGVLVRVLLGLGATLSIFTFSQSPLGLLTTVCYAIFFLNLSTFAFQLIPIPGLDGWRVAEALFRDRNPRFFFSAAAHRQTIWLVAAAVVLLGPLILPFRPLDAVVGIFFQPASSAILGACGTYVVLFPCPLLGRF